MHSEEFGVESAFLGAVTALFSTFTPFKQIVLGWKRTRKDAKMRRLQMGLPKPSAQVYDKKGGDVTESRCILCARCVETCPYERALALKFARSTLIKSRNWLEKAKNE